MSAPAYTLAQLLTPDNLDVIRTRLLAGFQGAGFPAITEWQPKQGVEMSVVDMVGSSVADLLAADLPDIVAGGFLGKATRLWMDLLAETVYLLQRVPATKTTFNMDMVVAATAGPYTWAVGDVEVVAPTGNRYRSTTAANGPAGGVATLAFEAEAAGSSYNDDPALGMSLVTTFAGVTTRASKPNFSDITQLGASTGRIRPDITMAVAFGGAVIEPHTYAVRIDVTGDRGTARWSLQVDGADWQGKGILHAAQPIETTFGLLAYDGSGSPSSFIAGDIFTFAAPGSDGFVGGNDAETDQQLATRCRRRWPSLSLNPTAGLFQLWALLAFPTASRTQVSPELPTNPGAVAGRVSVACADARGPLDPSGLAKITGYILPKLSILDGFVARQATSRTISVTGTVTATPATLVAVQQAASKAFTKYLSEIPLGGVVEVAAVEQLIMDSGAVDVLGLEINFAVNVLLSPGEVPVPGDFIGGLTWAF